YLNKFSETHVVINFFGFPGQNPVYNVGDSAGNSGDSDFGSYGPFPDLLSSIVDSLLLVQLYCSKRSSPNHTFRWVV
ncbi:3469_t:CDS:2, partial [Gigaspora rosea]